MPSTFVHNVLPAGPSARPAPIDSRTRLANGGGYAAENALQGALALGQQFADMAQELAASGSLGIKLTANDLMKLGYHRLLELQANAQGRSGVPAACLVADEFVGYSINEINCRAGATR